MSESPDVADVIRAIANGAAVEWDTVSPQAVDESLHGVLSELRVIARIAEVHGNATRAASESDTDAGPTDPSRWGPLTVLERVGRGSYGTVYRAWDPRLEREVALKLLPADDQPHTASVEEARLLARVRHPNVATVYGADHLDGGTGIWMEFVDGRDLEQILHTRGPLPVDDVCEVGRQLCQALGAVHAAGLLHRDITARNVMRQDDGRLVLMDFGTGQEVANASGGGLVGTPVYVAPEILEGAAATPQSDIYSVGVLLFYLTTGAYPVHATTVAELRRLHAHGQRQRLRDLRADFPVRLTETVERATAARSEERYGSAADFEAALSSAIAETTAATDSRAALSGWPAHTRSMAVAMAIVVTAAAAVLFWRRPAVLDRFNPFQREKSAAPALAIASGPAVRKVDLEGFIATGEPSRSGRWLGGVDLDANSNLAVLDPFSGERRVLTRATDDSGEIAEMSAISGDETRIAYSWYFPPRQETSELRTIGLDGSNLQTAYHADHEFLTPVGWAPDGRRVLIVRERSAGTDLAWVDLRTGTAATLLALPAIPRKASLSPDGALVAYDLPSTNDDTERDLFVCDAVTGRTMPLLVHPANDLTPVWVPNGTGLAFSSNRGGNLGLWFVPVTRTGQAGAEPQLVRGEMGRFSPIGFGRDAALFYHAMTGTVDVFVSRLDLRRGELTAPEIVATKFMGRNLFSDWSPDGRSVAFTSRRGEVGFEPRSQVLVIRELATENERVIPVDLQALTWPRWSPDGQSIVIKGEGRLGSGLYRVSLRDGSVAPLLIRGGTNLPEWSRPDGQEMLFVAPGDRGGRVLAWNVRTKSERQVVERGFAFALSPDGRDLAFARRDQDTVKVFVAPVGGGPAHDIFSLKGNNIVELAGWSADGRELVATRTERPPQKNPAEVLAVPVVGGSPRAIGTLTSQGARSFRLSPDATHLAFEAGYPSSSMWILERFINQ